MHISSIHRTEAVHPSTTQPENTWCDIYLYSIYIYTYISFYFYMHI